MTGVTPERPAYLARLDQVVVDEAMQAELAERRVPLGLFRARAAYIADRFTITPDQAVARVYRHVITAPPGPVFLMPPSVERALWSPQKLVALFGPARTGKTRGVCSYVYEHCRKYAEKYAGPSINWLYVRDTYESIRRTTLTSWLELFPPNRYGLWNEQKKTYTLRLPKGQHATVTFLGLDGEIGQLQSMDLTGFVIEEPAGGLDEAGTIQPGVPENVYRGLITRLSHPPVLIGERVRGILCGNTGSTAHWTFRVFRPDLPQPHGDGETLCVHVPEEESPVPAEYYDGLTRDLGAGSPEELRYRRGVWLAALTGGLHWGLFQWVTREQIKHLRLTMGATCDAAAGGKGGAGDRSAIVVAGFAPDGTAYVFDIDAGRFAEADLLARIFTAHQVHQCQVFGFESVAFSSWLAFMLEQEREIRARTGEPAPRIHAVALSRNSKIAKDTRIQGSLGVRLGSAPPRLYLVEGCRGTEILREELAVFGQAKGHDDVLDALSDLDQIARMPDTSGMPVGIGVGVGWRTDI